MAARTLRDDHGQLLSVEHGHGAIRGMKVVRPPGKGGMDEAKGPRSLRPAWD